MVLSAQEHFKKWIGDIHSQTPKTLAYWRVTHEPVAKLLEDFAATDSENERSVSLDEVQALFNKLNSLMADQEKKDPVYSKFKYTPSSITSTGSNISVVFGGKAPEGAVPLSISEALSARLFNQCPFVYTVSRSNIAHQLPANNIHVAKQNLDDEQIGQNEFLKVMNMAKAKWQENETTTLEFYMTLAQFKGKDPFGFNLRVATNFGNALSATVSGIENKKWKVVLTGTDATSPSDKSDSEFQMNGETILVPTYKMVVYNFTYSMSKIGQYYILANTVAKIVGRKDIVDETEPVISKISANIKIYSAFEKNGEYREPSDTSMISMEELSEYSRKFGRIERELRENFAIASGISICYTPLHAGPWTQGANKPENGSGLSPKAYIVEQIVRRLKNAISIEQAVDTHFP